MRVWIACLLALVLFAGCHQPPKVGENKVQKPIDIPTVIEDDGNGDHKLDSNLQDKTISDQYGELLLPVFFDYDKADIRSDQMEVLQKNALILRQLEAKVQIQGHCDERGTEEYNLALGDRRAYMVREYLSSLGIAPERLDTISFGEARPFEKEHSEEAWKENRRAHFVEEHRN